MKIEVDTNNESKEVLFHLANMLHALSGTKSSVVVDSAGMGFSNDVSGVPSDKHVDMFSDSAEPSGGLFSMFGDSSSSEPKAVEAKAPVQDSSAPSLFSIFGSQESGSGSASALQASDIPELLDPSLDPSVKRTSAKDILDDDRIILY